MRVFDAAVQKAYGGKRKISWFEVFAGEESFKKFNNWLPDDTVDAFKEYLVGIKGPLTTPVGGGIRSLNVALRQMLDLYVCLRPVQWFTGVPSPVKHPEKVDMTIFRENTEDIYAGIDFEAGKEAALKTIGFHQNDIPEGFQKNPFRRNAGCRWHRHQASFQEPARNGCSARQCFTPSPESKKSVTIVHKGNIMKFTEGGFRDWSYELAKSEFGAVEIDGGPWCKIPEGKPGAGIIIKDAIADIALQQVLTRPTDFDVIATLNLNGDYLSDALAAQVGGIGIAPGGNINYVTGHAIFEATHGTAPKYANKDQVNPGSVVLSGEMMLRYLGWTEAADLIFKGLNGAIGSARKSPTISRG